MTEEIRKKIVEPLEGYLNGRLTEQEVKWWFVKRCAEDNRYRASGEVREVLTPYYRKLLLADKGFFHNGNSDSQVKDKLLDLLAGEGQYVNEIFHGIDIVQAAENWADRLMPKNNHPNYFLKIMRIMLMQGYKTNWQEVYDTLLNKLKKAPKSSNFKLCEMHCVLMGITLIERTKHPRKHKDELLTQFWLNWDFLKYMYSVLIPYVVGLRVENFAALASCAAKKSNSPYMHLFYKAFKVKIDVLCPEGEIDAHTGKSLRSQAERQLEKMEKIIKETPQSDALNELCNILFPKVMEKVLKQSRPKTYEELEAAVDDLTSRYNKVLEQLTNAVKDVETDKISVDDLTTAFLRIPTQLALSLFGNISTLLASNPTWRKYAPQIHEKILAKPEESRIHVEGDYVVEKKVAHSVEHVDAGGIGINLEKKGKG